MKSRNVSFIGVTLLSLCLGLGLAACGGGSNQPAPAAEATPAESKEVAEPAEAEAVGGPGQELFSQVCAACHGPDGAGLPNLGKNLIESEFAGALTDEQLLDYIRTGRDVDDPLNTTGVAMPPSGGRPDLSDDDMLDIIAYVRTINTKAGVESAEAEEYLAQLAAAEFQPEAEEAEDMAESEEAEEPAESEEAEDAAESEEAEESAEANPGDAEAGQHLFAEVCAPCHGQQATGIQGIGLDLTTSKFVGGLTTSQLADFITMGRGLNNPFNFTEIRMPAKGGRSDLSDADALNIASYLHSINDQVGIESDQAAEYLAWLESGGVEEIEESEEVSTAGLSGAALDGQTIYLRFCAVCHGPNGEGVQSLGKSLIADDDFLTALDDDGLIQFISTGRPVDDSLNTTGIEMLPYGGQESLSDEELTNLVAFLRVINTTEVSVAPKPSDVEEAETEEEGEVHEVAEEAAYAIIDGLAPKCFTCHRISERGNKNGPGPNLNGLGSRAGDRVPGLSAQEYVKQAILDPGAFIVEECPAGPCVDAMPKNFGDQLSEEDLATLVDFLLSLTEEK